MMCGVLALEAAREGAQVAWVAPTYGNSRPMWRFVEGVAGQVQGVTIRRAEREAVLSSGGRVSVYTADNSVGMRGENFDIVICDEAPQYQPEVWTDVIMPTLADRDGMAYLIGTPKGRNWFYLEFLRGQADGKAQAAFTAPSSANPVPQIQRAAQLAKDRVSDRTYRQEWMAEFVADGAFFVNVDKCAVLTTKAAEEKHHYVIGVDWARSSGGDATVFSVIDGGKREQVALKRFLGAAFDVQLGELRKLHKAYNGASIVAEYNSMGGPLVERLQSEGLPVMSFVTTLASKHGIITGLELALENQELKILTDPTQKAELNAYEKKDRAGIPSYSAPEGMHDDTVMALAIAWSGVGKEMEVVENPFYA